MDEPWEAEVEHIVRRDGIDPVLTRTFVILRWMHFGDLRPLADAILKEQKFDEAALISLAFMILDNQSAKDFPYRVETKRRSGKAGASKKLGKSIRDLQMAKRYETLKEAIGSKAAFELVADDSLLSDSTVRKAQTTARKTGLVKSK
jgi:hypothetical protein